ncbi:MAG: patatin-like phospholipase family protein [Chloroflexi bacterium OHK40]
MLDGSYSTWFHQLRDRFVAQAQPPAPPPAPPPPRLLGLALGGGGGKGAAHVGVLQVLEELDVPIDVIAGTSAGGAVAVMYAAGIDFATMREVFRTMSLRRIALPDPTRTGLIGQRRREEILRALFGTRTFADLRIPCAVTATDLVSGKLVVIREGPLVDAVLATTAVPCILPPLVRGNELLADGGILNNLPVDVAQSLGAQRVVAVELNDAVASFSLLSPPATNPLARLMVAPQQLAVANRALSLLINHATALHLQANPPDLLLSPPVVDIPTLDLSNPEKGQQVGMETARAATDALLALRSWRQEPEPPPAPAPAPEPARPRFSLPFTLPRWGEPATDHGAPPQR